MATAVETGSESRTPSPPMSLPIASLLGAIYVVAAIAVIFYAVPAFWKESVAPQLVGYSFVDAALRLLVQLAVAVGLIWFGRKLLGDNPPKGVHGGIFLMISWAITIFFLWRALAMNVDGMPGMILSVVFAAFLVYLAIRFFAGRSGAAWMACRCAHSRTRFITCSRTRLDRRETDCGRQAIRKSWRPTRVSSLWPTTVVKW